MKSTLLTLLCIVFVAGIYGDSRQMELDSKGEVFTITKEHELNLQLFPEFENFLSAEVYEDTAGLSLEIRYSAPGGVYRNIQIIEKDELLMLRDRIDSIFSRPAVKPVEDKENSRKTLVLSSTILSLTYWGWSLPIALKIDDGNIITGIYLLGSGAGFFLPFYLTKDKYVSSSDVRLFLYGGYRGIAWGHLLALAVLDDFDRDHMSWGLSVSLGSAVAGMALSQKFRMTDGTAEQIAAWGDMGLFWGSLITATLFQDIEDIEDHKGYWAIAPFTSLASCAGGYFYGKKRELTAGDSYMMRTGAVIGLQLSMLALDITDAWEKSDNITAFMIPFTMAGFFAGDYFLRKDLHFKESEGFLTLLSQAAGSLIGAGVVFMFDKDGDVDSEWYFGTSLITGCVSSYITWKAFRNRYIPEMKLGTLDIVPLKGGAMGIYTARF
ncbi:hypothetical protein KAU32_07270 [bacterium]|nr:hypothetical protein [bacterium]